MGDPNNDQNKYFRMENPKGMDDLGVPPLQETSIWQDMARIMINHGILRNLIFGRSQQLAHFLTVWGWQKMVVLHLYLEDMMDIQIERYINTT